MGEVLKSGSRNPEVWGSNYWISIQDYRPTDIREIKPYFTELARHQYAAGVRNFYVEVNADATDQIQQWFELGFGMQHVSAILRNFTPTKTPPGILIRRPTVDDIEAMAHLERSLTLFQNESPVFSQLKADDIEELKQEWREEIEKDFLSLFVAESEGEVIALAYGCSTEVSQLHSGVMRPENSATFAFCAVREDVRGTGVGKAIATAVIQDLYKRGFSEIVTDWRATNQTSSNTWPKLGFVPTMIRLARTI
jgi:GNAT superfamily N-acetyltransferase